jgi:hypothetical protein
MPARLFQVYFPISQKQIYLKIPQPLPQSRNLSATRKQTKYAHIQAKIILKYALRRRQRREERGERSLQSAPSGFIIFVIDINIHINRVNARALYRVAVKYFEHVYPL